MQKWSGSARGAVPSVLVATASAAGQVDVLRETSKRPENSAATLGLFRHVHRAGVHVGQQLQHRLPHARHNQESSSERGQWINSKNFTSRHKFDWRTENWFLIKIHSGGIFFDGAKIEWCVGGWDWGDLLVNYLWPGCAHSNRWTLGLIQSCFRWSTRPITASGCALAWVIDNRMAHQSCDLLTRYHCQLCD